MHPVFLRTVKLDGSFAGWRNAARRLAAMGVTPEEVCWQDPRGGAHLFAPAMEEEWGADVAALWVPAAFVTMAETAACHRDPRRWDRLYRLLFRLIHGEPHLLSVTVDDDVYALAMMEKAVRQDVHKTKAFVRFREVVDPGGGRRFVAFHRPDHYVLPLVAPFFVDRFHAMRWSILTPDASLSWDGHTLCAGPGAGPAQVPQGDDMETFWKTYYGAIFNPARVRLQAMSREMPKKHWATLPEAEIIDELVRRSPARVNGMLAATKTPAVSAADFLPARPGRGDAPIPLPQLQAAAVGCRGCDLCERATQTVFGVGPANARIMLIGEQPGDQEDLAGRPFVGPAGQVLSEALNAAGLRRESLYLTNAVKHFKWTPDPRGKRRIHGKPGWREVTACRAWVLEEIRTVRPQLIVTLGVTAAQALLGPDFRLAPHRGILRTDTPFAPALLPTLHPAALLRIPDETLRARQTADFQADLVRAAAAVAGRP
jgi:DNA polymerase